MFAGYVTRTASGVVLRQIAKRYSPVSETRETAEDYQSTIYDQRLQILRENAEGILSQLINATYEKEQPLRRAVIQAIQTDNTTRKCAVELFNGLIAPVIARGYEKREDVLDSVLRSVQRKCRHAIEGIEVLGKHYHHDNTWTLETAAVRIYTEQQHEAYKRVFDKYLSPMHLS